MTDLADGGGCPCGTYGPCCTTPDLYVPEHEEPVDDDEICEQCFVLACANCAASCACDL